MFVVPYHVGQLSGPLEAICLPHKHAQFKTGKCHSHSRADFWSNISEVPEDSGANFKEVVPKWRINATSEVPGLKSLLGPRTLLDFAGFPPHERPAMDSVLLFAREKQLFSGKIVSSIRKSRGPKPPHFMRRRHLIQTILFGSFESATKPQPQMGASFERS